MLSRLLKNIFFNDEYCYFCKENKINSDFLCEECKSGLFKYKGELLEDYPKSEYRKDILYYYRGTLKTKIKNFKFDDYIFLKKPLGKLIFNSLDKDLLETIDYISFVPISDKKLKDRGYNQCELLAEEVSKHSKIQVLNCLKKNVDTKDQHFLSMDERAINLNDVFSTAKNIKNKRIILIDDIHTSGNTVDECYRTLKKSGVEFVWIVCICGVR